MVKYFSRSSAGMGQESNGSRTPLYHSTYHRADTFDSFSPTALHSSHSLSHQNCRSGRRQALHSMAPARQFKPSQHPSLHLHTPTCAGEGPNQVLPQATGGCHSAIHLHSNYAETSLTRLWAEKRQAQAWKETWDCTSFGTMSYVRLALQHQDDSGVLHQIKYHNLYTRINLLVFCCPLQERSPPTLRLEHCSLVLTYHHKESIWDLN